MVEVLAAVAIITAEKRAPNTAGSAMIIPCVVEADLLAAGNRHVDSVPGSAVTITADRDRSGTYTNYSVLPDSVDLMGVLILV